MSNILGLRIDKLCYFHNKCFPTLRSKTKNTKKYFETKTLFKEVTNLLLEVRTFVVELYKNENRLSIQEITS